jgi:hypothetical protein
MTPRQIGGALYFVRRPRQQEATQSITLGPLAARGGPREIKRQIDQMQTRLI